MLRSAVAGYAIQAARLAIGLVPRLILAHLLLPEVHGLYAWALRIVTVASALRDLGLPYHLIRDPRRPYGTVFGFTLVSGALLTLVVAAAAPLAGVLDPALPAVVRVFAVWILLDGLVVVPRAYFERELRIGRLVMPEIWRALAFGVLAIALAVRGWGVWSLVWGDLAGTALLAAYTWWRARGRLDLRAQWRLLPDLLRRSSWLFLIGLVFQLVTYLDIFILGSYADSTAVGLYSQAWMLAFLVASISFPRALFPSLVAYRDDPEREFAAFRIGALQLLGLQILASYFLWWNAERVVLVFGPAWLQAAPILRVLAFVPFLNYFALMVGELLKARHRDRAWLGTMLLNLAALIGFGIWLSARQGATGMAVANFLLVGDLAMAWYVYRIFGRRALTLLGDVAAIFLLPLPLFALAVWAAPPASWLRFNLSLAAAALGLGILALRYTGTFRAFYSGKRE